MNVTLDLLKDLSWIKNWSLWYDLNEKIEINPETGEIHYKPKWYKLVFMITAIYRVLFNRKALFSNWLFSNRNKKGFINYSLYDNYIHEHYYQKQTLFS